MSIAIDREKKVNSRKHKTGRHHADSWLKAKQSAFGELTEWMHPLNS